MPVTHLLLYIKLLSSPSFVACLVVQDCVCVVCAMKSVNVQV